MKNLIKYLMVFALLFTACQKEDIESVSQEEQSALDFKIIKEFMNGEKAKTARARLSKGDNNGNGVYFVSAITSVTNNHGFFYEIPGTEYWMALDSPSDGRDRAIILDDNNMRLNWNIRNPKLFLYNINTGITKYTANYCDEDNTGLFHLNAVVAYTPIDINNDGVYDVYLYLLISEDNGKNGILTVKATLTDALTSDPWYFPNPEDCGTATEEIEFSYIIKAHNGEFKINATFK